MQTGIVDGVGRPEETQLNSDPVGTDYIDTTYDKEGRKYKVWNPTRCSPPQTNDCESTWGFTTYNYDALNRVTSVVEQDGSAVTTDYSNFPCATVTDEAGKQRQSCVDGLGRLTKVIEDPGSSPHLNYETDYKYDALDNLLSVTQSGSRQRTFTYDSLSRLVCAANPETQNQATAPTCPASPASSYPFGTASYAYDANGNLLSKTSPAPNQTGTGTVTVSSCYDVLNRLTAKAYTYSPNTPPACSNGTFPSPAATFTYDVSSIDGASYFTNTVGRLVKSVQFNFGSTPAATYNSYDPMGRVLHLGQCVNLNATFSCGTAHWYNVDNTYDLAGDLTSYTDALGNTFTQAFDSAGRPTSLKSNWIAPPIHPQTIFSTDAANGYFPNGSLRLATFGNGLTEADVYNTRLQPWRFDLNSSSGTVLDLLYGYNTASDNGNIASWNASGQQTFARSFSYDSLNRLASMQQTSGAAGGCGSVFGLSWTIDAWGNRTDQNVTAGTCNGFHQAVNSNNQFVAAVQAGYYDAAGNLTADGTHNYFYDAENRTTQVDGQAGNCTSAAACYLYNAAGQRVLKTGSRGPSRYYLHGSDGQVVADTDGNAADNETFMYFGGRLVAEYRGGNTGYYHRDHLGSTRLVTLSDQSVYQNMDYLPYGEKISNVSGATILYQFGGKEYDFESGLDYFEARYMSSQYGRFMTPDWAEGDPDPVPYADLEDPQTLNLYGYVRNNPVTDTDPDGHFYYNCPEDDLRCNDLLYEWLRDQAQQLLQQTSQAVHTAINWMSQPRTPGCVGAATLAGASAGAVGGAAAGLAGGPFAEVSVPVASATGSLILGAEGWAAGMNSCMSGSGSGGGGGSAGGQRAPVRRSAAAKKAFLKQLAKDPNTPSWMKQWLDKGLVPPGYNVDHIVPFSVGGADDPSNMRLVLEADHDMHHAFFHPWR